VKVFQLAAEGDSRLTSIVVPGELVVEPSSTVVTRSKAKEKKGTEKWTTVALSVKILQLILKEYQVILEEAKQGSGVFLHANLT
jgi:hypothetical protein